MSARSVCSGTRPSRYHSVRAISAPPRRPEHCTWMPRAPAFWALCTARFMARRNAAAGELVGDALGDEGGVELGLLDLLDVELHLGVAGDLGQPAAQAVGLGASAPDHDARARGVHVDAQAVAGALDLDPADGRVRQLRHQVVADLPVLDDDVAVLLAIGEPARLPLGGDAEPEPVRVDLLTHQLFSSSASSPASSEAASSSASSASSARSARPLASAGSSASAASSAASISSVARDLVGGCLVHLGVERRLSSSSVGGSAPSWSWSSDRRWVPRPRAPPAAALGDHAAAGLWRRRAHAAAADGWLGAGLDLVEPSRPASGSR